MEESSRLIPYSLYLPEDIHKKLKAKAKSRQASAMVRDAITMILEGNDEYVSGYSQALKDMLDAVGRNQTLQSISFNHCTMANLMVNEIEDLSKKK